jgi:hypothetical protein
MSSATAHLRVRARRFALLLGGTAAIALSAGEPVRAIVINDQVVGPQQAATLEYTLVESKRRLYGHTDQLSHGSHRRPLLHQ